MVQNKLVQKINRYLNNHPFIVSMIIFICTFILFGFIRLYASGDPLIGDHYFHLKYADLLRTRGWNVVKHFNFIYSIADDDVDNGRYALNLFQVSLIPFTFFKDKLLGLQLADVFQASSFIAIVYYVMRKSRVQYSGVFVLLMLTSSYFVMRLLIGRAFVLVTALIFVEMYFAIDKKYKALFATVLLHVLWHQNTYFMPVLVVGVVETSRYLMINKTYWKNVVAIILAIILATAFFPGFPMSLIDWISNIFEIQSGSISGSMAQSIGGNELISKDFMAYFADNSILLLSFVVGTVGTLFLYVLQKQESLTLDIRKNMVWVYSLFLFMIVTMLGTITISGRFFDFLFPTVFVLLGFITTIIMQLQKINIDKLLIKFLKTGFFIFIFAIITNVLIVVYAKSNSFDYEPTKKVTEWVMKNSEKGDKVFLYNWGVFTNMFFGNNYNRYSMGIEPTALKHQDESVYWKYYNIFLYNYYCEKESDCKKELENAKKQFKSLNEEQKKKAEKYNSRKIIEFVKNDFDANIIISNSDKFSKTIELNPEMIETTFHVKSDKFKGGFMEYTVFKLR